MKKRIVEVAVKVIVAALTVFLTIINSDHELYPDFVTHF